MRSVAWIAALFVVLVVFYGAAVVLFGFEGTIGVAIQFGRVSVLIAALIVYGPLFMTIFQTWPPPAKDYLLAGTLMMLMSAVCFALWNVLGIELDVGTSVYRYPIPGFFSLLLVIAGILLLNVADIAEKRLSRTGVIVGCAVGFLAVVVPAIVPLVRGLISSGLR